MRWYSLDVKELRDLIIEKFIEEYSLEEWILDIILKLSRYFEAKFRNVMTLEEIISEELYRKYHIERMPDYGDFEVQGQKIKIDIDSLGLEYAGLNEEDMNEIINELHSWEAILSD
jgi:hypothetical protein